MLDNGVEVEVEPKCAQEVPAFSLSKPGQGGTEASFEIVFGARSSQQVVGEETTTCLGEKGFCVVRVLQTALDREVTFDALKKAGQDNKFGRLADAIEEGYLGKGGRAKALWLDREDTDALIHGNGNLLARNDNTMTKIAQDLKLYTKG